MTALAQTMWALSILLSAVAIAQSADGTNNELLGDLPALQNCSEVQLSSQIYQSSLRPEIWYVIQENVYGAGEVSIGAVNVTSCLYLAVPIADFLTQVGLSATCNGSAATTAHNAAGRRLLLEREVDMLMMTEALLDSGMESTAGSAGVHRRRLSQTVPSTGSLSPFGSSADPPSSSSQSSNTCSAAFNSQIPSNLARSTLRPTFSYFATTEATPDSEALSIVFCIVQYDSCQVACLNVARFQAATDTTFAALCQLAGLS